MGSGTKPPKHPLEYYSHKGFPVKEILSKQYRKHRFNRLDIFVRYMCLEEYEETKNTKGYWWQFYKKMQRVRIRKIAHLNRAKFVPGFPKKRIKEFVSIIESFREKGYDWNEKSIRCDKNLELANGSHRIALCLWFGIEEIPIKWPSDSTTPRRGYSGKWFIKSGFRRRDVIKLNEKRKEVFKKIGLKDEETNYCVR